jgi:intracellular sulfur oxidation DsrE/DsrF family protein
MRKIILLAALICFSPAFLQAQAKDYRVVFDLTSSDTVDQKAVLHWIHEIADNNQGAKLEVVLYGKSLDLIRKGRSVAAAEVEKLTADKAATFKVCAIALKNNNVDKSELIPGVEIVPDGIYEIISKEREGWGYIKAKR